MEPNQEEQKHLAEKLFLEHTGYVRFIAFETVPIQNLVSDIIHEVFIVFIERSAQYDLKRDVRPLLKAITRNISLHFWREHLKTLPESMQILAEHIQSRTSSASDLLGTSDLEEELAAMDLCLKKLSPRCRILIEEHYFNGRPLNELADESDQNVNTLRSALFRIRKSLKKCIERIMKNGEIDDAENIH